MCGKKKTRDEAEQGQHTNMRDDAAGFRRDNALLNNHARGAPDVYPCCFFVRDVEEGGCDEDLDYALTCTGVRMLVWASSVAGLRAEWLI